MEELPAECAALPVAPTPDLDVLLHPRLPELYRRRVPELERVLEGPDRTEAMDLIRSMIERVEITPRADSGVDAVLHGNFATILAACGEAGAQTQTPQSISGTGKSTVGGCRDTQPPRANSPVPDLSTARTAVRLRGLRPEQAKRAA